MISCFDFAAAVHGAVSFLHDHRYVHFDLKPGNILVKRPVGDVPAVYKLGDFGMAATFASVARLSTSHTPLYAMTRWYRAPEVVLGRPVTSAVDLWSLGCVVAEFAYGKAVFRVRTAVDLVGAFVRFVGPPPSGYLDRCRFGSCYFRQLQVRFCTAWLLLLFSLSLSPSLPLNAVRLFFFPCQPGEWVSQPPAEQPLRTYHHISSGVVELNPPIVLGLRGLLDRVWPGVFSTQLGRLFHKHLEQLLSWLEGARFLPDGAFRLPRSSPSSPSSPWRSDMDAVVRDASYATPPPMPRPTVPPRVERARPSSGVTPPFPAPAVDPFVDEPLDF